jgi:CHASE2 domain-containing sensor protein
VIYVAFVVPAVVLDVVDPFSLSRAVQAYSEKLFQKVSSSFYGSTAQDRIAVVLIDQYTLAQRGESWPPRYAYWDEVIRRIARQKPEAIFLDVLIEDRRAYDESLAHAQQGLGRTLTERGVPLYVATLDAERNSVFADVPGVQPTMVGWSGYGDDYPLLVAEGHFFEDGGRPTSPARQCRDDTPPTAAFALYRQLCAGGQAECPAQQATGDFCDPMVVQWGRNVAPIVQARELISATQCQAGESSWVDRASSAFGSFIAALTSGLDADALKRNRQPCPYAVTVREEDLGSERARGVLEGRVVMIGLSLAGIHDMVESPVHGQIPGVYLHAMALDNLLTWSADYFKRGDSAGSLLTVGALLCWISAALIRANPPRLAFFLRLFAILLVLAVSVYLYLFRHRPPLDWLGLLLIYELAKRVIENTSITHPAG